MIYLVIFLNLITSCLGVYTYVGTTPCSDASLTTSALCTQSAIQGKGYCYFEGSSCLTLPCYMIDEVAACRTGSTLPTGGASTLCDSLETFSLQYDNVCCDKSEGKLNYAFVRFTKTTDGYNDRTSDGTTLLTAISGAATDSATIFKLYTVNLWLADTTSITNFQTTVGNILDKYIALFTPLITLSDSHPFYLERTVYQSLQLLRDFLVLQIPPSAALTTLRSTLQPKIWSVALIALFRMTRFQPNYYQTNYYFINFAIIPYSRLSLTMNGQQHTTIIDWSTYSYTTNGFLMVYSFPPEQFGIRNAYSDVICLRPISSSSATYVGTKDNFDATFKLNTISWTWTDTALTVVAANLKLYTFPLGETLESGLAQYTAVTVTFTCDLGAKKCTSSTIGQTLPNTGANFYITTGPGVPADKTKTQCRLQLFTYTTACA